MSEKGEISLSDGDDGLLNIDLTPSGLSACMSIKSNTGLGMFAVAKGKNPLIFQAIEALYQAVEAEGGIKKEDGK